MARRNPTWWTVIAASALLAACGGDGGGTAITTESTSPADITTETTPVTETPVTEPPTTLPATLDLAELPGRIALLAPSCDGDASPDFNGERVLCTMRPDGTERQQVSLPGESLYPRAQWSYDGRHLTYVIADGSIMVVDLSTGEHRRHDYGEVPIPGQSPDGQWFLVPEFGAITLARTDLSPMPDGSDSIEVIVDDYLYPEAGVSWSPDSTHFAYVSSGDGSGGELPCEEVWIGSITDVAPRQVTHTADGDSVACAESVSWSPDGTTLLIVFAGDQQHTHGLFTVAADGSQIQRIAGPDAIDEQPGSVRDAAWSPDGQYIVALVNDGEDAGQGLTYVLVVMNATGGQATPIAGLPASFRHHLRGLSWAAG